MNLTERQMIGMKFSKLTVLEERGSDKRYNRLYLCRCDCGGEKIVRGSTLRNGEVKSCGCARKTIKHGMYGTRLNRIYRGVRDRCLNKNAPAYKYYGGRGIKCYWNKFEDFYCDMAESYKLHVEKFGEKETTIDRINNNGDYCKDNCKWSTPKEQAMNRRGNVDYLGYTVDQIKTATGVNDYTIRNRILSGLSKEKVFHKGNITSRKRSKQYIIHNGKKLTPSEVAVLCGVSQTKAYKLFKKGCDNIEQFSNTKLKTVAISGKTFTAKNIQEMLGCSKTRSYVIFRQAKLGEISKETMSLLCN